MFRDLVILNGDPALLAGYRADGTPLIPPTPAPPLPAPPSATAAVLPATPVVDAPSSETVSTAAPAPQGDEVVLTHRQRCRQCANSRQSAPTADGAHSQGRSVRCPSCNH
ncbi:MAG: hypothetical protein R3E79_32145 [Caldilineaceae bacterium]